MPTPQANIEQVKNYQTHFSDKNVFFFGQGPLFLRRVARLSFNHKVLGCKPDSTEIRTFKGPSSPPKLSQPFIFTGSVNELQCLL